MRLVIIPGDGIGPEITEATRAVLAAADARFGLGLSYDEADAGNEALQRHGQSIPDGLLERVQAADGLVMGPMDSIHLADPSKGEVNPSAYFRRGLDLYANIRPARTYEGVPNPLSKSFDLVIVRENTEGFYADRNMEEGNAEIRVTPDVVVSMRRITKPCCDRIARAAFRLAATRRKQVTAVHKGNVLRKGDGMFLDSCRTIATEFPGIALNEVIVDAMAAHLVRDPARYDVIVTTNMFGDILSDLTAELSGSIGLGGSINAGDRHAMAQAAHGSAPDIAGQDKANPVSLILSAAQLLAWHGERTGKNAFASAAAAIEGAVAGAVSAGEATRDVGGRLGTRGAGRAMAARV
jgi:3-isopropylmalate dehydrogenase